MARTFPDSATIFPQGQMKTDADGAFVTGRRRPYLAPDLMLNHAAPDLTHVILMLVPLSYHYTLVKSTFTCCRHFLFIPRPLWLEASGRQPKCS